MSQLNLSQFEIVSQTDDESFQSMCDNSHHTVSTNPFINTPVQSILPVTQAPSDVDRLINALQNIPFGGNNDVIKDIRHIDSFSGSGDEIVVVAKLKTLFNDFDEFFNLRSLPENQKIILLKQKLTGQAKDLINHHRPSSYASAKLLLTKSFGTINLNSEKVLEILKSLKLKPNEKLRQFVMRLIQCAEIVADKLECSIQNKIIFDVLTKTFLSNFEPYVAIQTNVITAKNNRDFDNLTNIVLDLAESNPEIIKNKAKSNINNESNSRKQIICDHCHKAGHSRTFCYALYPNKAKDARRSTEQTHSTEQDFRQEGTL